MRVAACDGDENLQHGPREMKNMQKRGESASRGASGFRDLIEGSFSGGPKREAGVFMSGPQLPNVTA